MIKLAFKDHIDQEICDRCKNHPAVAQLPRREGGVFDLCRFCWEELGLNSGEDRRHERRGYNNEHRRGGERRLRTEDRRGSPGMDRRQTEDRREGDRRIAT